MDEPRAVNLDELAGQLLADAAVHTAQRAANTLPHPVDGLRQTVIALVGGQELAEHESPGPASLLVLRGAVRLVAEDRTDVLGAHEICPSPEPAAQPARGRGLGRPAQRRRSAAGACRPRRP